MRRDLGHVHENDQEKDTCDFLRLRLGWGLKRGLREGQVTANVPRSSGKKLTRSDTCSLRSTISCSRKVRSSLSIDSPPPRERNKIFRTINQQFLTPRLNYFFISKISLEIIEIDINFQLQMIVYICICIFVIVTTLE